MTAKECYAAFGGNYDEALGRLLKDERIVKYLKKYAESTDLAQFHEALAAEKWEEAFRMIHNVKGVALNLALTPLATSGSELCETLRGGKPTVDISPLVATVVADDARVRAAIAELD